MLGFDRNEFLVTLGTATCLVGLTGVGLTQGFRGSSHIEERGLAAVAMDGPNRVVGMHADGARRIVIEVADDATAAIGDVPSGADEWVEGRAAGSGRPWSSVTIHLHGTGPNARMALAR